MALELFSSGYITIDIGFRYIKIVQVKKNKNEDLVVLNFGIADTPKGCIKNGAIKDKAKVVKEIGKVMDEHRFSAKEAKIVMSGTNIITRIILVEQMPESELESAIWNEIHACLPVDPAEHRIDFKILGRVRENGSVMVKVFVTAVAKKIIDSYIDILNRLNLKPISVDIPSNSVSKFFQRDLSHMERENFVRQSRFAKLYSDTIAVVDLGSETTIVNFLKNKVPEFNRVLLKGSSNIDTSIFEDLNLEEKQMDLAERYKKMYGLVKYKNPNNELEWQCSEATKKVMNQITRDISMCIEFYLSRCKGEKISKMYLIGGGSQLKGLKDHFEDIFNVPVYPIDVVAIQGIGFSSGLDREKVNYLVNALGAAI